MSKRSISLFCNCDFLASQQAKQIVESFFSNITIVDTSNRIIKQKVVRASNTSELIISIFNSKRILALNPEQLNFNIHAGPPWLRGAGTYARAVYHKHSLHGVTAHEMLNVYDTGNIIACDTFSIKSMSALQVAELSINKALELLAQVCSYYAKNASLPNYADEHQWSGDLITNSDFFNWLENVADFGEKQELLKVVKAFAPKR